MSLFSKSVVLDGVNGDFQVREFNVPEPKEGEFILRTEAAGVCGTDVHIYQGHLNIVDFPVQLGHEFCGIIDKLGKGVTEDAVGRPVKVGDRVVVVPGVSCGECYYCKILKTPTRCTNNKAYGFMPPEEPHLLTGGFGQYVHIKYKGTAFFKTELKPEVAVLTEPMSIAVHGFEKAGGVRFGSSVVVQGTGAIGLGAIAFARLSGAAKIIAVGGPKRRLELAKSMGADVIIDIDEITDPQERIRIVKDETKGGRGSDMVVECAGFPSTVPEGLSYLRDNGSYVEMGHFTDVGNVELNPHWHMVRNAANIHGVYSSEVGHMEATLNILERLELPYEDMVTHQLPLDRVSEAVQALSKRGYRLDGKDEVIKIAINPWI